MASNIFSNDPSGPEFSHEPIKFRPEMAVIFRAKSFPGSAEGLAWVSAANNVNCSNVFTFQFGYVLIDRHVRPVLPQHLTAEWIDFAESHRLHPRPLKAKAESTDAGKQVKHFHRRKYPRL